MKKEIKDVNKCIKIIHQMLLINFAIHKITFDDLIIRGYEFEVHETDNHKYHVICFHPTLKRLDFISNESIFV